MSETLFLVFLLAFAIEGFVEYALGSWVDDTRFAKYNIILGYLAMAIGVGLSFYYSLDLLVALSELIFDAPVVEASPVGFAITGIVMGRGSEYLHKFVSRFLDKT